MFDWYLKGKAADIYYGSAEHRCIALAAQDLAADTKKVFGKKPAIKPYLPYEGGPGIVIGSLENPDFRAWAGEKTDLSGLEGCFEKYRIAIGSEWLIVAGSDRRGAMWGLYTLCENVLHVDPGCALNQVMPEKMEELRLGENVLEDAPATYRFRGWFLNDEDLLTDFRDGGGARHIDYPFYAQVSHPDIIARVLETALRMKINMIIPASFLDIRNPAEENLVRLCTDRGLYVTQHHVEPLGVSHFGFENYWKARGREEQFSFLTNREKVMEVWRDSIRRWAKYDGVIWQIGLRGRGDKPIWADDKSIGNSNEAHGAIISEALQTQCDLIREELGTDDFIATSTLWMEGTELYHQGCLKFPKNTVIVFADAGLTQLFGRDFYELARMKEYRYGLYYHVAFWGTGPHLTQGTDLRKMEYQYRIACGKGDTFYSILNVSNVRENLLCAQANAEMIWNIDRFDETRYLNAFFARHFGLEHGAEMMHRHFDAFADYPEATAAQEGGYATLWKAQAVLENVPFKQKVILDGAARRYGLQCLNDLKGEKEDRYNDPDWIAAYSDGIARFEDCWQHFAGLLPNVNPREAQYYTDLLLVQEEIILWVYEWAKACGEARIACIAGDREKTALKLRHGVFALRRLIEDRKKAEWGQMRGWYRGDKKMGIPEMLRRTEALLRETENA